MELILLLVKIIGTVVLVGISVMFLRLLDALVLTPKRIRSQLQIQPITQSTPPSSLAPNNTQFKGKQVQRICFHRGEYGFCRGSIRIWPKMGTSERLRG
ncbi:hypothetical protein ES319_D05G305400v1 [Gossypium barbadense]|uniref:Uncharacterized protein n=2 Tax=Gossypium TaxID=3633 RepID=A0A5J5RKT1_GOSBA|nr:hypothetical protein ES319_D05G305400v1 [Gossypium barbadense]TYG70542.1 hypothetical protein ES288_D05G322400v1 [Gossypium darwinii]